MSSVIIAGNTSGTITLDAPNVAGTTTLTLPTTSGTIITTTSPKAGNVIQVVNTTAQFTSNYFSTGSTSLVSTGATVTITPQFSSSKIFLIANAPCGTSTSGVTAQYTIYRTSTNLATGTSPSGLATLRNSAGYLDSIVAMSFLDSPSTTSSTTYTVYMCVNSGSATFGNCPGQAQSAALSFTAMEIAA